MNKTSKWTFHSATVVLSVFFRKPSQSTEGKTIKVDLAVSSRCCFIKSLISNFSKLQGDIFLSLDKTLHWELEVKTCCVKGTFWMINNNFLQSLYTHTHTHWLPYVILSIWVKTLKSLSYKDKKTPDVCVAVWVMKIRHVFTPEPIRTIVYEIIVDWTGQP